MKRTVKTLGMLLMLFIAYNLSASAQRGMRSTADTAKLIRPSREMNMRDTFRHPPFNRMRKEMAHRPVTGICPMVEQRIRAKGFNERIRMEGWRGNERMGNNKIRLENIPGLTVIQKTQIADLNQKQKEEMKKLSAEIAEKSKGLRTTHKMEMLDLLTDEQKKFLESGPGI